MHMLDGVNKARSPPSLSAGFRASYQTYAPPPQRSSRLVTQPERPYHVVETGEKFILPPEYPHTLRRRGRSCSPSDPHSMVSDPPTRYRGMDHVLRPPLLDGRHGVDHGHGE